ncbi:hypothetical protein SMA47_24440, partial [Escherichia coli]
WEITIRSAAFAGPKDAMLFTTVQVMPAPITPPKSIYFGSTFASAVTSALPARNHTARHARKALNCTQILLTHNPVVFVTCVLNTP